MFRTTVSFPAVKDRFLGVLKTLAIHGVASLIVGVIVALAILIVLGNPLTVHKVTVAAIGAQAGSMTSILWAMLRNWLAQKPPN